MPTKPAFDFMTFIVSNYGLAGLILLLLAGTVGYLVWRNAKDRKDCRADFKNLMAECREDFNKLHDTHRQDRNEWVETLKEQQLIVLEVVKENSEAYNLSTVATKELSIHIQNCQRNR